MRVLIFFLLLLTLTNFADVLGNFPVGLLIEALLLLAIGVSLLQSGLMEFRLSSSSVTFSFYFLILVILNIFPSFVKGYSHVATLALMPFYLFTLSFFHSSKEKLRLLFSTIALVVMVEAFYDVFAFLLLDPVLNEDGYRSSGFGMQPNVLAVLFVAVIPYFFALYRTSKSEFQKLLLVFSFLMIVFSLLITGSRSGVVLFAIMLLTYALLRRHFLFIFTLAPIGLLTFLLNPLGIFDRFQNIGADKGIRVALIDRAFDMFQESPWLGVGFQNTAQYTSDIADKSVNLGFHNTYLTIAVELGLPMLLLFIVMLLVCLKSLYMKARHANPYAEAAFISLLVCAASAFTNHFVWYSILIVMPFVVDAVLNLEEEKQ
jgi:O-antigen ligase